MTTKQPTTRLDACERKLAETNLGYLDMRSRAERAEAELTRLRSQYELLDYLYRDVCDKVRTVVQNHKLGLGGEDIFDLLAGEYETLRAKLEKAREALRQIAGCECRIAGDVVDIARIALKQIDELGRTAEQAPRKALPLTEPTSRSEPPSSAHEPWRACPQCGRAYCQEHAEPTPRAGVDRESDGLMAQAVQPVQAVTSSTTIDTVLFDSTPPALVGNASSAGGACAEEVSEERGCTKHGHFFCSQCQDDEAYRKMHDRCRFALAENTQLHSRIAELEQQISDQSGYVQREWLSPAEAHGLNRRLADLESQLAEVMAERDRLRRETHRVREFQTGQNEAYLADLDSWRETARIAEDGRAAQERNTLAFARERDELAAKLEHALAERDAAKHAANAAANFTKKYLEERDAARAEAENLKSLLREASVYSFRGQLGTRIDAALDGEDENK